MPPLPTTSERDDKYANQFLIFEQSTTVIKDLVGNDKALGRERTALQNAQQAILYHEKYQHVVTKRLQDAGEDLTDAQTRAKQLDRMFKDYKTANKQARQRDPNDARADQLKAAKEKLLDTIRKWLPDLVRECQAEHGQDGAQSEPRVVEARVISEAVPDFLDEEFRLIAAAGGFSAPSTNEWTIDTVGMFLGWYYRTLNQTRADLEGRVAEIDELKQMNNELQRESPRPQADPAELQELKSSVARLQREVQKATEKNQQLREGLRDEKEQTSRLKDSLSKSNEALTEMQDQRKRAQRTAKLTPKQAAIQREVERQLVDAFKLETTAQNQLLQDRLETALAENETKGELLVRMQEVYAEKRREVKDEQEENQQLERTKADLEVKIKVLEKDVQKSHDDCYALESMYNQFVPRLLRQIASPDEEHIEEDDVWLVGWAIGTTELARCSDASDTFNAVDSNHRADMAAHLHAVEWMPSTLPASDFSQMLLNAVISNEGRDTSPQAIRADTMWMDLNVMKKFTSNDSPVQEFRAVAMRTFLLRQLSVKEPDGLGYAWAAGMQVEMMCWYDLSTNKLSLDLTADITTCPILQAIGIIRLKLARRYFVRHRGMRDYTFPQPEDSGPKTETTEEEAQNHPDDEHDEPEVIGEKDVREEHLNETFFTHPFFNVDNGEAPTYFTLSMPLFIKKLCGGQNRSSKAQGFIVIKENYVGVGSGNNAERRLYSWLRDEVTGEWTFTTSLPTVGRYDGPTKTGDVSWDLEHRVHTERYAFAEGDAGFFRRQLQPYVYRDMRKAMFGN